MSFMKWRWGFWWRPFGGRGVYIGRDTPMLFSERYGYVRAFRLGRWCFKLLKTPGTLRPAQGKES